MGTFIDTITGTKKENITDIWDIIIAEKFTNAMLLPSTLHDLLENQDAITKHCYKLHSITTGRQLVGSHLTQIIGKSTYKLCMLYGTTEVREMCFIELTTEMEVGYVGPFLPGYEVKIIGEKGETLNRGQVGEILVRSPRMLKSYRNAPELNETSFADGGWYRTGTIGNITTDGKLFVKGKSTDIIKRGSVKVLTSVVETTTNKLPGVRDVVVLSVPDIRLSDDVCACYLLERHAKTTESEMDRKCRETLGDNVLGSTPSYFLQFHSFPKLSNGKTDKALLKKKAMERLIFQ
ncbi:uncharacterized protein LOC110448979 isoform X4 [Mizuhopecten yessoensis]|uniref:uncharacterized protein LOC110448979 isoform X4 n=1 Tax=Mizuhopecten yessoensis TaxID=6573 RepID=UPI000B45AE56|nr:uncharacterized protein LOC110448979 isoform X4 [Mizuhopecten yessoensis]